MSKSIDVNSKLKCLYMNARSIVNKKKELELTVTEENLDVIAITETWLNKNVTDEEMSIKGYTLFREDRNDTIKRRGGGVAMYIKNELNPLHKPEFSVENFSESLWCSVNSGGEYSLLGVCYRPPIVRI
jgi:exonuclease III